MKTAALVILGLCAFAAQARADGPATAPSTAPAATVTPAPPPPPTTAVFSSDAVSAKFSYPLSLTKVDAPDPNAVVMFRHLDAPQGEIHLQVNANGKPLPDAALGQVADGMADLVTRQHGTVISRTDTTLGSAKAVKLVFSFTNNAKTVNICGVTAIYDGRIYTLAAAAPAGQFDKFQAIVQPMYDTFEFTKAPDKK